jgi:hypothetical protein
LLDFAQRANQLFQGADITTKNKALRFLNGNSMLYDKTLSIKLIITYKAFNELNDNGTTDSENTNWCSICDALQTSAIEEFANPKLQDLAKLFNLSPDLLSV